MRGADGPTGARNEKEVPIEWDHPPKLRTIGHERVRRTFALSFGQSALLDLGELFCTSAVKELSDATQGDALGLQQTKTGNLEKMFFPVFESSIEPGPID